jgi:hypothetical protein
MADGRALDETGGELPVGFSGATEAQVARRRADLDDPAAVGWRLGLPSLGLNRFVEGPTVLRRVISGFDDYLSRQNGVALYDDDARCLLRYAASLSTTGLRLADGARICPGDFVADLHLWNEHIPPVPEGGPNLAWAREFSMNLKYSFRALAAALENRPELRAVKACRARTTFAARGSSGESLSRITGRFGFEEIDEGIVPMPDRIHDAFENLLLGALVWTHNPRALRRDKLLRQRRTVWISRELLLRLHGSAGES